MNEVNRCGANETTVFETVHEFKRIKTRLTLMLFISCVYVDSRSTRRFFSILFFFLFFFVYVIPSHMRFTAVSTTDKQQHCSSTNGPYQYSFVLETELEFRLNRTIGNSVFLTSTQMKSIIFFLFSTNRIELSVVILGSVQLENQKKKL